MFYIICPYNSTCQTLCEQFGNLPIDETLSGTYNTGIVRSNKVILLNGDVTLRGGAKFTNCKLKFANAGTRLNLINSANGTPGGPPPRAKYDFITTKVFSCAGQWNSIVANNDCLLQITVNSEFEGGFIAIDAKANSIIKIIDSKFYDNNVGIQATGNVTNLGLAGNLFTSRVYTHGGMSNNNLRGIHLKDVKNLFDIGNGSTATNIFEKLYVGIGNSNSQINIKNSQFRFCYVALSSGKTNSMQNITITGLGKESTNATFKNNGLFEIESYSPCIFKMDQVKSVIDQNSVTEDKFCSVYLEDISDGISAIRNSAFHTTGLNDVFQSSSIYLNYGINVTGEISDCKFIGSNNNFHSSIIINKLTPQTNYLIKNNIIEGTNCYTENFEIQNSHRIHIVSNNSFKVNTPIWRSIHLSLGSGGEISNNKFENNYTTSAKAEGIYVDGHSNGYICHNEFIKAHTGVKVEGTCGGLIIGESQFYNNKFGLHYLHGAITNFMNEHSLNRWLNASSVYDKMAQHDEQNGVSTYFSNIYLVKNTYPGLTGIFNPPNNKKFPTGDLWIKGVSAGSPAGCPQLFPPGGDPHNRIEGFNPLCDIDYLNQLTDGQKWDVLNDLWMFSVNNPNVEKPICLNNLIQSVSLTNIPTFSNIHSALVDLGLSTSNHQIDLKILDSLIEIKFDALLLLKSYMAQIEDIQGDEPELSEINILEQDINTLSIQRDEVIQDLKYDRMTVLTNLEAINSAILPQHNQETEQQFLNSVNIKKLMQLVPTQSELDYCKVLSERCIVDYGNLVLYAQSLLPIDLQYQRMPLMFCSNSTNIPQLVGSHQNNPSQVQVEKSKYSNCSIKIFSLDGRLVSSSQNTTVIEQISVHKYLSGIYIFQIEDSFGNIHMQKINF